MLPLLSSRRMYAMNSKYSNDQLMPMMVKIKEYWITADGKPELKEFAEYMLDLLEQTRTNTIKAAIEALPEKRIGANDMHIHGQDVGFDQAITQATANLKALIGGDDGLIRKT